MSFVRQSELWLRLLKRFTDEEWENRPAEAYFKQYV